MAQSAFWDAIAELLFDFIGESIHEWWLCRGSRNKGLTKEEKRMMRELRKAGIDPDELMTEPVDETGKQTMDWLNPGTPDGGKNPYH